jgi:hypothetical protein
MIAIAVYLLCATTALACAVLLLRGWAATRTSLLLWAGLCFVGLTVNNVLLFLDMVVVREVDLAPYRGASALLSLGLLLYGLVWEGRRP